MVGSVKLDEDALVVAMTAYNGPGRYASVNARMQAAIRTYLSAVGGQAVAVKPLEWEPNSPSTPNSLWVNVPEINRHYTIDPESNVFRVETQLSLSECGSDNLGLFPTIKAAKAAAQADYERRILTALSQPHPADERVVEALRENLRQTMLEQTISGNRETYSDGFSQGLCFAIEKLDAISAKEGW